MLWSELKDLSAQELWDFIKKLTRDAQVQKKLHGSVKGTLYIMIDILDCTRKIEALEAEREFVNTTLGQDD